MNIKIQKLSKILICSGVLEVLLFLYTRNYLDLIISLVINILLLVFICKKYLDVLDKREYETKSLNFLVSYVSLLNTYKNSMIAYDNSKDQLSELNFNYSFDEVSQNEELLNELKLGENLEYVKNSINGKVNYEACEEMVKTCNERLDKINNIDFIKRTNNFLFSSLGLLLIFPVMRIVFGEDLLDYSNYIFHISSIFIYVFPLFLLLLNIFRSEKNEK